MRAGIAFGSNLGDRLRNLQRARDAILTLDGATPPFVQSAIYETTPVDCEPGAGNFYNAVIEIDFAKSAEVLLQGLQNIEEELGREKRTRHGESLPKKKKACGIASLPARHLSRMIDLDLLYFGEERRAGEELQLPHPRLAEREFVLRPLRDMVAELRLPGETASVRELLARIEPRGSMQWVTNHW